jgi:predicted lipid-binding transport protein (Tim44 family)
VAVATGLWWYLKDAAGPKGRDESEPWWNLAGFGLAEAFGYPAPESGPPPRTAPEAGDASFIDGACDAYEMILQAVADGDLTGVAGLLTAPIRADFEEILATRRRLGEVASLTLIGISTAEVIGSGTFEQTKWADVRICADLVSFVRDREGQVIRGDHSRVSRANDLWTIERDMVENGGLWRLAATSAGQ